MAGAGGLDYFFFALWFSLRGHSQISPRGLRMFGKETQDEEMNLHIKDYLLVTEDKISISGTRLHVVLHHSHRKCKSQEARCHQAKGNKERGR
jgi:peptide subunit release factor 1 (eRF1)